MGEGEALKKKSLQGGLLRGEILKKICNQKEISGEKGNTGLSLRSKGHGKDLSQQGIKESDQGGRNACPQGEAGSPPEKKVEIWGGGQRFLTGGEE